ncbi:MAG TPA: glycine-rich protein [Candidatus Cybelea sp.]|nr:glycine-rich protein [Candidatus Cybelea sp.]
MIDFRPGRYSLGICAAVAVLGGCGGHASNGVMLPTGAATDTFPFHSFYYTGKAQSFKVPAGVRELSVVTLGALGYGWSVTRGARLAAIVPVTPGETLLVYVGGNGSTSAGGFNGGADGGDSGYGGGGATDIRQGGSRLSNRILVAAGAGGQGGKGGSDFGGAGGSGGRFKNPGGSGGGGGGSSYAERKATDVRIWRGWKHSKGNGLVVISW